MGFNKLSDLFWRSSSAGGDYFHIVLYSLVSAGIFLLIFKICSNQDRIRRHKRKIVGYILQIGLYKDRPRVVFSSALHVLKHNLLYLRCALPSLAILMAPALLVSTQINNRCGYAPLDHGESFIVAVQLDDAHLSAAGPGALERV
ncbi:MAG: hypothetical protein GY859_41110, partial [Desulfobacterales bacterium]|nr:hypothetical protein [Desulfobacterales bacterium]